MHRSRDAFDDADGGDTDDDEDGVTDDDGTTCPDSVLYVFYALCRSLCRNVKWRDRKFKERESQGRSTVCFGETK